MRREYVRKDMRKNYEPHHPIWNIKERKDLGIASNPRPRHRQRRPCKHCAASARQRSSLGTVHLFARRFKGASGAATVLLQNDTAMVSVANRVIAIWYITLSLRCGEQRQNRAAFTIRRNRKMHYRLQGALRKAIRRNAARRQTSAWHEIQHMFAPR